MTIGSLGNDMDPPDLPEDYIDPDVERVLSKLDEIARQLGRMSDAIAAIAKITQDK